MVIEVKNLKKTFTTYERGHGFIEACKSLFKRKKKECVAVDGISFSIAEGEVVGFLGPNGAGKSTTLKALSGILYPDSGEMSVLRYVPWKDRKKYVQHIGVVFGQKSQLFWDLPPIDSFYLHRYFYRLEQEPFQKQLDLLIGLLKINDTIKRPTRQLSLGERMKCEFVMAMLHQPKIVFLDEPTIGLDVFAKEAVRAFIKEANTRFKTTFIVTSHDLDDIEHLCNRVIIINHGKVVFDGAMSKLTASAKKIVTVMTHDKVTVKRMKGVKVLEKISPYSVKLEVDTKKLSLTKLLQEFPDIADLEVSGPDVTAMIKEMYTK